MDTKICTKCNIVKSIDQFRKNKNYKNGIYSRCKQCECNYQRENSVNHNKAVAKYTEKSKAKKAKDSKLLKEKYKKEIKIYPLFKKCSKCQTFKKYIDFHKINENKDGLAYHCKDCINKAARSSSKKYRKQSLNNTRKYQTAKLKRCPKWANLEKIKEIYMNCPKGYHVDHIIPLRGKNVSGLHVENNLQYLPASENHSKGNKYGKI